MPGCPAPEPRLVAADPVALHALRSDVLGAVGAANGAGVLYAVGYLEGLAAALRQLRALRCTSASTPSGRAVPSFLLFTPAGGELPDRFWGRLAESPETPPGRSETGCLVSAGYAAGWYSELLGQPILVREVCCRGQGARECRFEARPLAAWLSDGERFAAELLPFLDFAALRRRAEALTTGEAGDRTADAGFGDLDPSSPAMHVWGPLMILPYGGCADAEHALAMLLADELEEPIRVALVDLGGVRLEALELCGLAQLLQQLHALDIEPILVGLTPAGELAARAAGELFRAALFETDLPPAIARAFQLCRMPCAA